jgi:hypothetical protein
MPTKQPQKKIYRSANGRVVDLDLLMTRNELTPAVGNVRVNARGDELGPGGKVIRKKEDLLREYYNQNNILPKEPIPAPKEKLKASTVTTNIVSDSQINEDDWDEDENGDFVKK